MGKGVFRPRVAWCASFALLTLGLTVAVSGAGPAALAAGFDTERVVGAADDWEPVVAADPGSNNVYQIVTRYSGPKPCKGCPLPTLVFRRSTDGGASYGPDAFLIATKQKQNDPQLRIATSGPNAGSLYVAWLDNYNPGVKFIKSSDHGATWSDPVSFTGKGRTPHWSDKPWLAISPDGQDVYLAFNSSDSYVAASHDGGATFAAAVQTNNDTRYWFHTGGAVASNGDVYFAAVDFSQDYTGDAHIDVLKSIDGGATWSTTTVDTSKQMPDCPWSAGCTLGFLGSSASLVIDASGRIVVAYNANRTAGAPEQIYVSSSIDGGGSWSTPLQVSPASSTVNCGFPALAAGAASGDLRLAWQDDRNGATTAFNTWYRSSGNGGASWSADVRLSNAASGAPYKSAAGYSFPYGDYFSLSVDGTGTTHAVWGEGTSYTGPGGCWYTRGF
jgi:hypothetical protein